MWSSMYSAYDALSPHMRVFLEGLTATHDAEEFREQSAKYVELVECALASSDRSFLQIWIPTIHKRARTPRQHRRPSPHISSVSQVQEHVTISPPLT